MNSNNRHIHGLDVGTSRLVLSRQVGPLRRVHEALNAYLELPTTPQVISSLKRAKTHFTKVNGNLCVLGRDAVSMASFHGGSIKRTLRSGTLNLTDRVTTSVLQELIRSLLQKEGVAAGSTIYYSSPSVTATLGDGPNAISIQSHESVIDDILSDLGVKGVAVKEGVAAAYSLLAEHNFTGIGISFGAGLTNVSVLHLSIPLFDFSIAHGGDYIDENAARIVGVAVNRMQAYKENTFSFSDAGTESYSDALRVLYSDLISRVIDALQFVVSGWSSRQAIVTPLPVAIAGGTSLPKGFAQILERALQSSDLPFPVGDVYMASNPLYAISDGCLAYGMACDEEFSSSQDEEMGESATDQSRDDLFSSPAGR